jgi:lysophospholipase L1-like esterase
MFKGTLSVFAHMPRILTLVAGFVLLVAILTIGVGLALLQYNKISFAQYWRGRSNIPGNFTLVIIGDSVSQGVGASKPEYSFVGLLTTQLEKATGSTVRVINLSRSGATTRDALDVQVPRLANIPQADLVVLEIGANDMRNYNSDAFARNYEQLLQALPPEKSIVTDVPVFSGHPILTRQAQTANKTLYALAAKYKIPVAPVFARIEQRLATTPWFWIDASDLFHPNNRGHRIWYDATWPKVSPLLDAKLKK